MRPPLGLERLEDDRATLTSRAVDALRAAIVDGRLVAGRRHSVAQLAERLRASRTPVREAEHVAILDALRAHDSARAARAMRAHLVTTGRLLLAQEGAPTADLSWEG